MKQKENVDPNAATNGYFYFETIGQVVSRRVSSVSCRKMHFKHCPLGQP